MPALEIAPFAKVVFWMRRHVKYWSNIVCLDVPRLVSSRYQSTIDFWGSCHETFVIRRYGAWPEEGVLAFYRRATAYRTCRDPVISNRMEYKSVSLNGNLLRYCMGVFRASLEVPLLA